jgi:hypothetical protein
MQVPVRHRQRSVLSLRQAATDAGGGCCCGWSRRRRPWLVGGAIFAGMMRPGKPDGRADFAHQRLDPPGPGMDHAPRLDRGAEEAPSFLGMYAVAPGAVALAARRAALAAMQPADPAAAHRRLPAGAAIGLAPGAAARHEAEVAAPVAGRPHPITGHEVGFAFS